MDNNIKNKKATKETQYNKLLEYEELHGIQKLGLMANQCWEDDPRRFIFMLSRYKFVSKMLSGYKNVLEVGCGDAFANFENYPIEIWQKTIDVNLTGAFVFARESGRCMKEIGGGHLINVSSIYGIVAPDHRLYNDEPFKSMPGYAASKAGIIGLTNWLSTWWAKDNIRVNCISPGGVDNNHSKGFKEKYSNKTPMGRMAEREELVGMFLFLVSDASSYCTGQNYIVDGGFTTW